VSYKICYCSHTYKQLVGIKKKFNNGILIMTDHIIFTKSKYPPIINSIIQYSPVQSTYNENFVTLYRWYLSTLTSSIYQVWLWWSLVMKKRFHVSWKFHRKWTSLYTPSFCFFFCQRNVHLLYFEMSIVKEFFFQIKQNHS